MNPCLTQVPLRETEEESKLSKNKSLFHSCINETLSDENMQIEVTSVTENKTLTRSGKNGIKSVHLFRKHSIWFGKGHQFLSESTFSCGAGWTSAMMGAAFVLGQ